MVVEGNSFLFSPSLSGTMGPISSKFQKTILKENAIVLNEVTHLSPWEVILKYIIIDDI